MGRALEQVPIVFPPLTIPEDHARKKLQHGRVLSVLKLGAWLTLAEIAEHTGDPEASISARIRGLKAAGHPYEKRRRGGTRRGTWEYRLKGPS